MQVLKLQLAKSLPWTLPLLLIGLTALAFWPGLSGDFLFDDYPNILTNERLHITSWSWQALWDAATSFAPGAYGRPLAMLGFAVDYLLGGKQPWGYKFHSLLVHLLNTALVFALTCRLLHLVRTAPGNSRDRLVAFAIALAWATHPLQVSSVLYVVQRMETLATTFVLLALLAYLRGRREQLDGRAGWLWLALSAVLAGVGMLSKEVAALFPVYTLALELTVLQFRAQPRNAERVLRAGYTILVSMALFVFVVWIIPPYLSESAFTGRNFSLAERLLTQLRVLPMYLGQMVAPLPANLTFYYDNYPVSTGLLAPPTTLLGGLLLLALGAGAWICRRCIPLVSLGIFWFVGAHAITSNVFNLELAFEHRNYFALLGILLALTGLIQRIPMRDGPALKYLAIGAILLGFGFLTILRSATWGDPVQLASDLAAKNPGSPRASSDMAAVWLGVSGSNPASPFFVFAEHEFERGSRLPGASPLPEQGLILMHATTGRPVKAEWWRRLIDKVRTRPISPQELMAITGLMEQRYRGIELDDALLSEAYQILLTRVSRAELHVQFADYALRYLHDEELADRHYIAAIELAATSDPGYPAQLVQALIADGRVRQANAVLQRMGELGLAANTNG